MSHVWTQTSWCVLPSISLSASGPLVILEAEVVYAGLAAYNIKKALHHHSEGSDLKVWGAGHPTITGAATALGASRCFRHMVEDLRGTCPSPRKLHPHRDIAAQLSDSSRSRVSEPGADGGEMTRALLPFISISFLALSSVVKHLLATNWVFPFSILSLIEREFL